MGIARRPSCRFLDLCHGPRWGLEAAISRFPAIRVTAVDFTDVFHDTARARAESAQASNRDRGHAGYPHRLGGTGWSRSGFGDPLPFPDGAFDAIFFTCGEPYIPRHLRGAVYRELGRLLASGGRLGVLTRSHPDDGGQHVPSFWLRVSALARDFAEKRVRGVGRFFRGRGDDPSLGWRRLPGERQRVRRYEPAGFLAVGRQEAVRRWLRPWSSRGSAWSPRSIPRGRALGCREGQQPYPQPVGRAAPRPASPLPRGG